MNSKKTLFALESVNKMFGDSSLPILLVRNGREIVYANNAVREIFRNIGAEIKNDILSILINDFKVRAEDLRNKLVLNEKVRIDDIKTAAISGAHKYFRIELSPIFYDGDKDFFHIYYICDISIEKQIESRKRDVKIYEEESNDVLLKASPDGKVVYVAPSCVRILGFSQKEIEGKSILEYVYPEDVDFVATEFKIALREKKIKRSNFRARTRSNEYIWLEIEGDCVLDKRGEAEYLLFLCRDITSRIKAEEEAKRHIESVRFLAKAASTLLEIPFENFFRVVAELLKELVGDEFIIIGSYNENDKTLKTELVLAEEGEKSLASKMIGDKVEGMTVRVNREAEEILRKRSLTKLEEGIYQLTFGAIPRPICKALEAILRIKAVYAGGCTKNNKIMGDIVIILRNKNEIERFEVVQSYIDQVSSAWERKIVEEELRESIKEKELLIKEVHHRVKNNMQVILSLLNLQSMYIKDERDLILFSESQNRVRTMSLVHEKIYRSKDLSKIDFEEYLSDLTPYLIQSYGNLAPGIELTLNVEKIKLGVDKAVPLGLIVNELITNSLKYAFINRDSGKIYIEVDAELSDSNFCFLKIGDNGVGLPNDFDFRSAESLGMTLVNSLVKQLSGEIKLLEMEGVNFLIKFPK